ncbi:MxaK protein [Methylophaga sp. UBA2689]|uniref:MxaK protein n=1 Tax=Methylophaga sp. UBA2689 TaxID=1946878 RepID=UPI0025DFDA12|nr:MxaK protein [Methylophaga sp. UBA2689]|tara:strand:+ start:1933 stop:2472 length:540 start_codon:yes stop_codon:yes gene_type:complete
MSNTLKLLRWVLLSIFVISIVVMLLSSWQLWQQKRVEAFVSAPEQYETIPDHPRAHFAQGRYLVEQNENDAALEQYTLVLGSQQTEWLPAAYFNRGNINLREAMAMDGNDPQMIPLVELAKQDYRSALKQQPEFWDARFNLEVALRLVPEDPEVNGNFKKQEIYSERSIETKAFKVDLP